MLAHEHGDAENRTDLGPVPRDGLVELQHQPPATQQHRDVVVVRAPIRAEVPRTPRLVAQQGAVQGTQAADAHRPVGTGQPVAGPGSRVLRGRLLHLSPRGGGEREVAVVVQRVLDDRVLVPPLEAVGVAEVRQVQSDGRDLLALRARAPQGSGDRFPVHDLDPVGRQSAAGGGDRPGVLGQPVDEHSLRIGVLAPPDQARDLLTHRAPTGTGRGRAEISGHGRNVGEPEVERWRIAATSPGRRVPVCPTGPPGALLRVQLGDDRGGGVQDADDLLDRSSGPMSPARRGARRPSTRAGRRGGR